MAGGSRCRPRGKDPAAQQHGTRADALSFRLVAMAEGIGSRFGIGRRIYQDVVEAGSIHNRPVDWKWLERSFRHQRYREGGRSRRRPAIATPRPQNLPAHWRYQIDG